MPIDLYSNTTLCFYVLKSVCAKSYFLCLFKFTLTVLNFNFSVLPSFWKDISIKYTILDWWFLLFSSNTLKMSFHCSLPTQFLMRKMLSFFFSVSLWDVSFFSGCLYNFPFITVFQQFDYDVFMWFSLCFFRLGSLYLLNLLFLVFIKFGMFLAIISSNTFFIFLPQSGSPISFEWLVFQMPLKFYFFFSPLFSFWTSFWMSLLLYLQIHWSFLPQYLISS